MDNVVKYDMFLYLTMLNLLKENYVLPAIQLSSTVNNYLCRNGGISIYLYYHSNLSIIHRVSFRVVLL